jgi:hypothetical protein
MASFAKPGLSQENWPRAKLISVELLSRPGREQTQPERDWIKSFCIRSRIIDKVVPDLLDCIQWRHLIAFGGNGDVSDPEICAGDW